MLLCMTVEQFAAYFPGAAYKFYHKLNSLSSCITYKQTNSEKLLTPSHPLGTWGRDERVGMSELSLVTTLPRKLKFSSKVIFCFATQLLVRLNFPLVCLHQSSPLTVHSNTILVRGSEAMVRNKRKQKGSIRHILTLKDHWRQHQALCGQNNVTNSVRVQY